MEKKEKFKNIEFLRFIGVISILCFHIKCCMFNNINGLENNIIFANFSECVTFSEIWVDFFFIISGFFFFRYTNFSMNFENFFLKKYFRYIPSIAFAIFLYWLLAQFDLLNFRRHANIFTLFLINNIGLTEDGGNIHPVWFVSSLFWAMMLLFYLRKICSVNVYNFILAVLVYFCYIYVVNTTKFAWAVNDNFLCAGVLRAIGGLSIGYFINIFYNSNIANIKKSIISKIFATSLELYLFGFIFYYTFLHKMNFSRTFPLLVLYFVILFTMFVLKSGYLSKLLDNNFSVTLGKYSYSIFVMHIVVYDLITFVFWKNNTEFLITHPILNLLLPLFSASILGIITYHFVEQPSTKYFNKFVVQQKEQLFVKVLSTDIRGRYA